MIRANSLNCRQSSKRGKKKTLNSGHRSYFKVKKRKTQYERTNEIHLHGQRFTKYHKVMNQKPDHRISHAVDSAHGLPHNHHIFLAALVPLQFVVFSLGSARQMPYKPRPSQFTASPIRLFHQLTYSVRLKIQIGLTLDWKGRVVGK